MMPLATAGLPPGPRNRLLSTYRILATPRESTEGWIARYGDPVLVPAVNGNVVMLSDPALAKEVFAMDRNMFQPFAVEAMAPLLGRRSMLVLSGEEHLRERKLLMPAFHGARMRRYGETIRNAARHHLDAAVGRGVVPVREIAQSISMEVIIRTIFGVEEEARVAVFARAVVELIESAASIMFFVPALQRSFFGLGPYAKLRRRLDRTDEMLQEQIDRTRARGSGDDVLSMMLEARFDDGAPMTDAHIKDELRTLLIAGHETTATVISWAIDAVHRDPEILGRLQRELDVPPASDDGPLADAALPYLDLVAKETLRRYPIVSEVLRLTTQPLTLGRYAIPAGYGIGVSVVAIHHRPDLYPEPEQFRPERFSERRFGPHEFLPYGGGHRRCLGSAFADFELRVVLATAVREFAFDLQQRERPRMVRRNVTMAPRGGVPVIVQRR